MTIVFRLLWLLLPLAAAAQAPYYPEPGRWERRAPAELGLDAAALGRAVGHAIASEAPGPRDLVLNHYRTFGREPFGYLVGPVKDRGEPTGLIVHRGYIVAEWGEPARVDMTHSVTKSVLSTVVGVAFDRGLIRSLDDPVRDYVGPIVPFAPPSGADKSERLSRPDLLDLFATAHNRAITWDHLLRQTSDWEGTLWGKPDWADRPSENRDEWTRRARHQPGTVFEYNDVRVNVLALAALEVWRRPLPQVLKETIMDPIGASSTWRWYGYENSWIVLDGQAVQSVSGGGHWGGGLFIDAYDLARFGYLTLRKGRWKDRQLVSERWIGLALTPTPAQPHYGFMNWYNNRAPTLADAPRTAFWHLGAGTNLVYVDPENDLVIVLRWIQMSQVNEVVRRAIAALPKR